MTIQEKIRGHIVEVILFGEEDQIDNNVSFQESGILDSNGFLELITFVEGEFDIEISNEELVPEYMDSIEKITKLIEEKVARKKLVFGGE